MKMLKIYFALIVVIITIIAMIIVADMLNEYFGYAYIGIIMAVPLLFAMSLIGFHLLVKEEENIKKWKNVK